MPRYKVNRRIIHNFKAYNPGSEIDLTDAQAAQMKNGQITPIAGEPAPADAKLSPVKDETVVKPIGPEKSAPIPGRNEPAVSTQPNDKPQDKPAATGTDKATAPQK